MKWDKHFIPPSGEFAPAFQNAGRKQVIGQWNCGYEQRFWKPREKCDVSESGVPDLKYN